MSEPKFTPGPWSIIPYGDGDSLVLHSDGNTRICFMATPGSSPRAFPQIEANAHLIAAAPELYEQVLLLERSIEYDIRRSERADDDEGANLKRFTLSEVRRVLAKARGEQQ